MEFLVSIIAIALMVIGAFGVIFMKKPLDKIIMFDIMDAGFVLVGPVEVIAHSGFVESFLYLVVHVTVFPATSSMYPVYVI